MARFKVRNNALSLRGIHGKGFATVMVPPGDSEIDVPDDEQEAFLAALKGKTVAGWIRNGVLVFDGPVTSKGASSSGDAKKK